MDTKGIGYLVSIVSVVLIGAVAWPKPSDPEWMRIALLAGMISSIIGMGLRYLSHRREARESKRTASH